MACCTLQMVALLLGSIGMVGTFTVTLMPQWKVSAFTGNNIIVFEKIWEGLWMVCVSHINKYQCKFYGSLLALPPALEASRGLMCTACGLSAVTFLIAIAGMKCITWPVSNEQMKSKILLAAGGIFLLTGVIVLIPVSLVANNIIRDFYNPVNPLARKHELGAALYLGWITSVFLISGGAMFCSFCHCAEKSGGYRYSSPASHRLNKPEDVRRKPLSVNTYV
ncbi:claudin-8-like [Hemicordylus capensis]|uniref:claudin-8-like n=1 Tax=Hemicordylus capensis TaxID=884348 RepID=UPI002302C694|nr:claudin-8-like [Hemicordylus capensis]